MRERRPEFGEAVRAVLSERALSLRQQRRFTGIDHVTMADMCEGFVPRMERVLQFARAFDLDENEWLEQAGYGRVNESAQGYFWRRYGELYQDLSRQGISPPLPEFQGGTAPMTFEEAEVMLERLREVAMAAASGDHPPDSA